MQERIREILAEDCQEPFCKPDELCRFSQKALTAIMAVFEESNQEAFKRGYAQGGVDTILQHEKASQAVLRQLKQSKEVR